MTEQPTEGTETVRSSRTPVIAAVGIVVALALATSGITLAGLYGGTSTDAPVAAPPAWLTPPGTGGPAAMAPMPGGAPAVPAMTADPSAPVAPPVLAAATSQTAVPSPGGGGGAVGPGGGSGGMGVSPPPVAPPAVGQAPVPAAPIMAAVPGGMGAGGMGVGASNPVLPTTPMVPVPSLPTVTTSAPPTTPTTPAPLCTPPRPLRMAFTYDDEGRVTSVVIRGLRPECGSVIVVLDLAGSLPTITVRSPVTPDGAAQVVLPAPLPPTAVGPATIRAA